MAGPRRGRLQERTGPTAHRQRLIALELGRRTKPVRRADVPRLSPEIAVAYLGKTDRTIARDMNTLNELDLVRSTVKGWEARSEIVTAFLPERADSPLTGEACRDVA